LLVGRKGKIVISEEKMSKGAGGKKKEKKDVFDELEGSGKTHANL